MIDLPEAIKSNVDAISHAIEGGAHDLTIIGALTVEQNKLRKELNELKGNPAPLEDIAEVRQTMLLPRGVFSIDGRVYCITDSHSSPICVSLFKSFKPQLSLRITAVHTNGVMSHYPFKQPRDRMFQAGPLGLMCRILPGGNILWWSHWSHLNELWKDTFPLSEWNVTLPQFSLLYSAERDGATGAAFHRHCDNKGPTFTVMQSKSSDPLTPYIYGFYNAEPWMVSDTVRDHASWLFSLQSPTGLLTQLILVGRQHNSRLDHQHLGPYFEEDLKIMFEEGRMIGTSQPTVWANLAPGFSGQTFTEKTFAGDSKFTVDKMEVYQVTRVIIPR